MRLLGRQLARFRETAGLTQRDLATELNLAEETVASIEQGRRPSSPTSPTASTPDSTPRARSWSRWRTCPRWT
ncbi:helix-turn-helix transcriptional regulator [Streptomyces zhihengii]